ncbi:uncharacterized protein LOC143531183 [Bidens hawaiensis]|uniref:uncharacterized protein LOC143531183 n=1 Tax=Bidens hawaiensis TaxID=980011 RepID=UPI00404A134C
MLKLYVMATNGYLPTLVFGPEQGFNGIPKDLQHLLPNYELRDDVTRSSRIYTGPQQNPGPSKLLSGLYANHHLDLVDPTITKPALINIQDCCPNSTLLSFKFSQSGLTEVGTDGPDLFSLSGLTGLQPVTAVYNSSVLDMGQMNSQLIYQDPDFDSRERLIDFVGDLVRPSEITIHEDGRVSLMGMRTEMKDILSVLAEFYLSKSSTSWRKSLVPAVQLDYGSAVELETVIVAPPKSPEKVKLKPSPKKKGARNKTTIRHRSNYSQACESLLSIIVDKNRSGKSAIPLLKKTGPVLPNLLTQFSASIAGTGIAVLFSVMCKVASGRVAFCSSKIFNTGLGLGLLWLSWAVNSLRDTVVMISKNSNKKTGLKDEEMMKSLDRSVKEIYFRAAALMAVMVLRLA